MLSGESLPFIKALGFSSKRQLLDRLNEIKSGAAELAAPDNLIVREMTEACIQDVSDCPEKELLRLKKYCNGKR